MKNQKGITLIALVVTIVVLLILAGTAIAMLQGDNGIITNAQKASYANTEGEAMDKIKFAFNSVSTEVRVQSATNVTGYNATEKVAELADIAFVELGGEEGTITSTTKTGTVGNYTVSYDGTDITIIYKDNIFKNNGSDVTDGKYNEIKYVYSITADSASVSTDYSRQVEY